MRAAPIANVAPISSEAVFQISVKGKPPTLATRATVARSFVRRMVGLLNRAELAPGEALIIPSCRSIHTAFMRFPIDAVFVDGDFQVVQIWTALPPWRVTPIVWNARSVIELPARTVQHAQLEVGDHLVVEPSA